MWKRYLVLGSVWELKNQNFKNAEKIKNYNKKSFVKFRGRFTKKRREYITNYVLPPFEATGKKIDLVEFV